MIFYTLKIFLSAREHFEKISLHCGHFADLIPVTFVLGFYVSIVITRWWQQFESIPWPGILKNAYPLEILFLYHKRIHLIFS